MKWLTAVQPTEEGKITPAADWPPRQQRWAPHADLVGGGSSSGRRAPHREGLALAVLVAFAVWARRPGYMLTQPLWLDEGWVAASVRAPLRQLVDVTSSSPLGWTLLLRVVPSAGAPERLRLVPLIFGVLAVVPAWLLGRRLVPRLPLLGGLVCGLAAALAPAMVARHDLKQYTAEGLASLALLACLAWVEAGPSRARLAGFAALAAGTALVSNATVFVVAAAFGALTMVAAVRRDWRWLLSVVVAGAAVLAITLSLLALTVLPSNSATMQRYWGSAGIPVAKGLAASVDKVGARSTRELVRSGFGPWPVALALVGLGVAGLWHNRLRASALVLPLTFLGMVVAGAAGRYPFLYDSAGLRWSVRTSVFLTVLLTVVAAIGLLTLVAALARRRVMIPLAAGAVVVAGVLLAGSASAARHSPIPPVRNPSRLAEDVRSQVEYVLAHRQPGDVVVVTRLASFSFAAYWPDPPVTVRVRGPIRYRVAYPGGSGVAVNRWPVGDPTVRRVWVIAAHVPPDTVPAPPAELPVASMNRPIPNSPLHLLMLNSGRQGASARGTNRP
jgi:MFS family permease